MRAVAEVVAQAAPLSKCVQPGQLQPAGGRPERRGQDAQEGCLAGAVVAEHGHVFAGVQHEVDALEGKLPAEPVGQTVGDKDAHGFSSGGVLSRGHRTKGPARNRSSVATMIAIAYAGRVTGWRRLANSGTGIFCPTLPSTTPRMMIAPPAQIQLTSGFTNTRNEADPSPFVPASTT